MRRGFVVPALLVVAIFMVLCVGMLSRQPMRNLGAMQTHYQVQARARWPWPEWRKPDCAWAATCTTFARELPAAASTEIIGSYVVTMDASWAEAPFHVLRIESEGFSGSATRPTARYVLRATLDVREKRRLGCPTRII